MVIIGAYKKAIYFNEGSGQSAFLIKPKDGMHIEHAGKDGLVKVTGKYCLQQPEMPLYIDGDWIMTEFGWEFSLKDIHISFISKENTEEFLNTLGMNLSQYEIRKIMRVAGDDIFASIFLPNIEMKVSEKANVEPDTVFGVYEKLRNMAQIMELFHFLDRYNGTFDQCQKILRKFPVNAVQQLKEDAYAVMDKAKIPFRLADQIALEHGADLLSENRIQAIVKTIIRNNSNAGHSYMTLQSVIDSVAKKFNGIPNASIMGALTNSPDIIYDKDNPDLLYEDRMYKDECLAAKEFARLLKTRKAIPFHPEFIDQIEQDMGWKFGEQQRNAFQLFRTTGPKLLTGDPGTGKTKTADSLLKYVEMVYKAEFGFPPKIALCAPAGRAAQRLKESTGRVALTVHKLIEYQPYGDCEYYKDANDPIDADVIVVDEISMIGVSTFAKLLAATKSGTLLLMIGDVNQLQSVEPGDVLQDILRCGYMESNHCHLSEIFRQQEGSLININAKRIINGQSDLTLGDDFLVAQCSPEQTLNEFDKMVKHWVAKAGGDAKKVQALSPVKKGECGVHAGNDALQKMFNPQKGGIWHGRRNYKLKDRVIMLANNYSLNYYNGDIGYIQKLSASSMDILVNGKTLTIPKDNYSDLDLAYFCTIHKSQGSEYPYVIIVLQKEAKNMLDQNLLYTAVTRAKLGVGIIYEDDMLEKTVATKRLGSRRSMLAVRIRSEMAGQSVGKE